MNLQNCPKTDNSERKLHFNFDQRLWEKKPRLWACVPTCSKFFTCKANSHMQNEAGFVSPICHARHTTPISSPLARRSRRFVRGHRVRMRRVLLQFRLRRLIVTWLRELASMTRNVNMRSPRSRRRDSLSSSRRDEAAVGEVRTAATQPMNVSPSLYSVNPLDSNGN